MQWLWLIPITADELRLVTAGGVTDALVPRLLAVAARCQEADGRSAA